MVTNYFNGLKALLNELDVLEPILVCVCDAICACDVLKHVKDQRNVNQVIRFLKGLNENYFATCSQLMLMPSLPSHNKVSSLDLQQER